MSGVQDRDDLLHEVADTRAGGIEPEVSLLVCGATRRIEALELLAVGGERPASVCGKPRDELVERHIEPHREAVAFDGGAVVRAHERTAARRHDGMPQRKEVHEHRALDDPEVGFALPREYRRDRASFAGLDAFIDILDTPAEPGPERACQRRLARCHEAYQIDLVRVHRASAASVSKKPGYETATASAPVMTDGPSAPSAATANAIARR